MWPANEVLDYSGGGGHSQQRQNAALRGRSELELPDLPLILTLVRMEAD